MSLRAMLTRCLSMFLSAGHRPKLSLIHFHRLCLCHTRLALLPSPAIPLFLREACRVIIMPGVHRDRDSTEERQTVQKTDNSQSVANTLTANTLWAKRYKRLTICCEHAVTLKAGSDAQPSKEQDVQSQEKMMTSHEIEMNPSPRPNPKIDEAP